MTISFYDSVFGDNNSYLLAHVNDLCTVSVNLDNREYHENTKQQAYHSVKDLKYPFWDIFTLAQAIDVSPGLLVNPTGIPIYTAYKTFYIDKETGKVSAYPIFERSREIDAPTGILKEMQKRLAAVFASLPAHPANYAFMKGKGIPDALERLKQCKTIIHADIKDFFTSHTALYVRQQLAKVIYDSSICEDDYWQLIRVLTTWVTYNSRLPQGAPTSPVLSVVLNYELDTKIEELATTYNLLYVRYADDLFFGGDIPAEKAMDFIEALGDAVHPFRLNHTKVGVMEDSVRPIPTGIIVRLNQRRISPSQSLRILKEFKEATKDETAQLEVSDFVLQFKSHSLYARTVDEVKAFATDFAAWLDTKYPLLEATCKPRIYHLAKTKAVLGAHINKGRIVFSRKQYTKMRTFAMLMGMQSACRYVNTVVRDHATALRSMYIRDVINEFAKVGGPNNIPNTAGKRNLFLQPYSRRQYIGKLNWIGQLQPEKANKLKEIELKYFKFALNKICNWLMLINVITEEQKIPLIEKAVNTYYGPRNA